MKVLLLFIAVVGVEVGARGEDPVNTILDPGVLPNDSGALDGKNENSVLLLSIYSATLNTQQKEMLLVIDVLENIAKSSSRGAKDVEEKSDDASIANAVSFQILSSKEKKSNRGLLRLTRMDVRIQCDFHFFYYPFDKQICSMNIFSSCDSSTNITVSLKENSLTTHDGYHVQGYQTKCLGEDVVESIEREPSRVQVNFLFVRKIERAFPILYFPVIALITISFYSMFLRSRLHAMYISIASFVAMLMWVANCQNFIIDADAMTLLDHYHFVCLNLCFNAATVSIMMYMFLCEWRPQDKSGQARKASNSQMEPVLGLKNQVPKGNEDECHIRKMSRFKQFVYFKGCKPARLHLPIFFVIINVAYWIWIGVARIATKRDFETFSSR